MFAKGEYQEQETRKQFQRSEAGVQTRVHLSIIPGMWFVSSKAAMEKSIAFGGRTDNMTLTDWTECNELSDSSK
jgi:hypothetical protein